MNQNRLEESGVIVLVLAILFMIIIGIGKAKANSTPTLVEITEVNLESLLISADEEINKCIITKEK